MTECALGTTGLLALAGTTTMACGIALTLGILPLVLEWRRSWVRSAFLRAQLLHQLSHLPQYLQERNRPLPPEHREVLDGWCHIAQHAGLLPMEEWTSVLRTQSMLMSARNRPSFTKRESRMAQQLVDHLASMLQTHASNDLCQGIWWKKILLSRNTHTTPAGSMMDRSFELRV